MAITTVIPGLETLLGLFSVMSAIGGMMVGGAILEALQYIQNPYLRQRRFKIMLNKMTYAFA
ncbi:hypothetical protein PQ077_01305 [Litorivicinus sp.]|nr:hypothetical protein [Litorivicinus sp.]